jgi:hypothetical protein
MTVASPGFSCSARRRLSIILITTQNHLDRLANCARSDAPTARWPKHASRTNTRPAKRCSCRLSVGHSTNLPIVWCCASGLGSRERGGRTRLQKSENQHSPRMTFALHVCASHSRFQSRTRDYGSCRKMPNFALSRRQRGFESRWGHKIKVPFDQV